MRWFALVLVACNGSAPTPPPPPEPEPDPPTADTAPDPTGIERGIERFRQELEAVGFVLAEGRAEELDPSECCDWESCYLFNPDNEYLGWWIPRGPGQLAPNPAEQPDGTSLIWRLRPDEAVVAVGRTPPPAAYFSYRTYLHDRWNWVTRTREWLFFNLGDSLNQFVIGTGEGGPFDADFALITTADANTERAIREAALRAGLPPGIVNTDHVVGDDLRLGLYPEADTFRLQARIALFEDEALGEAYLARPPITVWRVTPAVEAPHLRIVAPPLRARGTGTNESAWAPAMDALDLAVRETWSDYNPTDLPTIVPTSDEDECPPGCNRDTFFAVTIHYWLPEDADAFVLVYGVNHERTGKSVYSNFSVIDTEHLAAYEAIHSRSMPGSAEAYLPAHPLVDDLYVWKIARTCDPGDPYCIAVPYECPGFASPTQGSIAFRAYTEAATGTGPLTSEIVVDRAILFTRPAAP